jgi:hypothetical protein
VFAGEVEEQLNLLKELVPGMDFRKVGIWRGFALLVSLINI